MKKLLMAMIIVFSSINLSAWDELTHKAVGDIINFDLSNHLSAPDIARAKLGDVELKNHFYDCRENLNISIALVKSQKSWYNNPSDEDGHLYGAILQSVEDYQKSKLSGKGKSFLLAWVGHYIGDLSNPLHNIEYEQFNKICHAANDSMLESVISSLVDSLKKTVKNNPIVIKNEDDLAKYIVELASKSKAIGYELSKKWNKETANMAEDEKKKHIVTMTREQAIEQVRQSALLLDAVLKYVNYR